MRIKPLTWSYEVGVAGFEPTTSSSRTKRAAKLRYTPIVALAALAALATSITLADPRPETKSGFRGGVAGGAEGRRDDLAHPHPWDFGVSVRRVASGGHAKRTGVNRLVPQPAETWRYARWPPASCVERPFTRFVSRSQLVTSAP